MDILERIKIIMKMNQMNAAAFADRIGVQRSNVSHVLNGRNKPSLDFIEKTLLQFPKINASWLITGQVQAIEDPVPVPEKKKEPAEAPEKKAGETETKKIVKVITFYSDFTFDEYRTNS